MIKQKTNSTNYSMPDRNNSFDGKYDFLDGDLILSGQGFIGEFEQICLRLVNGHLAINCKTNFAS
jgi:hypothetical protein